MEGIDYAELERRLQLNEAELTKNDSAARDLSVAETIIFVATVIGIVLATLLWRLI